jgi:hypothetical protein
MTAEPIPYTPHKPKRIADDALNQASLSPFSRRPPRSSFAGPIHDRRTAGPLGSALALIEEEWK